jgi:hypothetical protein
VRQELERIGFASGDLRVPLQIGQLPHAPYPFQRASDANARAVGRQPKIEPAHLSLQRLERAQ